MNSYDTFSPNIPETDPTPTKKPLPLAEQENEGDKDKNKRKPTSGKGAKAKSRNVKTQGKEKSPGATDRIKGFVTAQNTRWILGLVFGIFAIYLGVAFISFFASNISDQSEILSTPIGQAQKISNTGGEGGARLSNFLINECFGIGSFVIVLWLFAMSLKHLAGKPRFKSVNFTIKCLVGLITLSLIVGLLTIGVNSTVNWGGYHGRYVNEFLINFLGWTGAILLCLLMIGLFVIICMRDVINWVIRKKKARDERRRIAEELRQEQLKKEQELAEMRRYEDADVKGETNETETTNGENPGEVIFDSGDAGLYELKDFEENDSDSEYNLDEKPVQSETESQDDVESGNESQIAEYSIEDSENTEEENRVSEVENVSESGPSEKMSDNGDQGNASGSMVVNVNNITESENLTTQSQGGEYKRPYKFPPFELLKDGEANVSVDADEQLENKKKIEKTLLDFGIPIKRISAKVGPTVTLYEVVPVNGVKVSKIRNLVDDIALSLAAEGVRIIAPIPGQGAVGIEVANKEPQTVSMRKVIKSRAYQESKYKLPVAIGSKITNEVFIADLAKMPHLLVAGATGQGKSVGLNAIIASLLYSKRPDELKFVMVDPKMVEFSIYSQIEGHYLAKLPEMDNAIITDMDKVVATLNSLCVEMDNRYKLLMQANTRNLTEYNAKIEEKKLNPLEGHRFLPYIVVIVDEFSDLIMTAGKEVEQPIARLAQKARAVGMHVIIATQRPSTNVITGIIKANFPARIAFKVSSGVDSKTILDTSGAQQLIGRGDMLISNGGPMERVQCAFIDTPEVEAICEYIARQPYAQGAYELPEPVLATESGDGEGMYQGDRDQYFEEAARIIVQSNQASTSSLQRRFSIGYNRAGKIMDQLEAAGIVGPQTAGKPRAVLVDPMTLESMLRN